jgi:hypothetical protein
VKPYWVLLSILACARHDGAEASSGQGQTAVGPSEPVGTPPAATAAAPGPTAPVDDVTVATRWLEALRDRDQQGLIALSRYPFELHDVMGECQGQKLAASVAELPDTLQCLLKDDILVDVLKTNDSAAVEPFPDIHFARWAKKWGVAPDQSRRLVTASFNRLDARFEFYLWVVDGGVRGVWKSGVNGAWAIKIAGEWLGAVRNRDVEQLARLTSYPLEVRDTRREARCGKRVAKGRDALAKTVDCLFKGELLHRALVESPSSGFDASEPSESLPEWVEPWWREKEHGGLQAVGTTVSTSEGYEFDFQILVARSGVRTVWKLGSFESRY